MSTSRKICGDKGEELVARALEKDGFTILERNYTRREGEVDIIATLGDLIVFVEVKTRTRQLFDLTEVINRTKQRRIIAAAKRYIVQHRLDDKAFRFDVACVENIASETISYIADAFNDYQTF